MEYLKEILKREFGIENPELKELVGEVNRNFLVSSGQLRFIFKESPAEKDVIEFSKDESSLLEDLSTSLPSFFQKPIKSKTGDYLILDPERGKIYRLLEYIEGELFFDAIHSEKLFLSFGNLLARMDKALMGKMYPSIVSRRYDWDNQHFDLNISNAQYIQDVELRRLVEYFHLQFHEVVVPLVPKLRFSIIQGDSNDYNVLVQEDRVTGIIDFGDSVYSLLINDLAIALSYALLEKDDPIKWALPVIEAYTKELPLGVEEIDVLYYQIATRLCISLCHSAVGKMQNPENAYLHISEKPVENLLRKWISISPVKARSAFRRAAGLPEPGVPDTEEVLNERWRYISKAYSLSYENPIRMEGSAFQYMYDDKGSAFLDLRNNIPHVGHCHPRVVRAGQRAMARLNTNTRYLYDEIHSFSEKLLDTFPSTLNRVFFVNSGSAASDLAIRLATNHTGRKGVMVMEYGYHGNTQTGIEISHHKFAGKAGGGQPDHILSLPIPQSGLHLSASQKDKLNRQQIRDYLLANEGRGEEMAAFITEPIVSAAGQIEIGPVYMREIYAYMRRHGGLCISDEVQTGFGRLGKWFWGFEKAEVIPDIVVLGKPIGNGHPMAAVVCTAQIADSFHNGMEFFSSFGGNPVSCAIGESVLDVIKDEGLAENAEEVGNYIIRCFEALQKDFPCFEEIRGQGLSLGVEIVKAGSPEPDTALAQKLVKGLRERNILVGTDGPFDNVFKLKPPLCFTKENVDQLISAIKDVLK